MTLYVRLVLVVTLLCPAALWAAQTAVTPTPAPEALRPEAIRIGVLTDMSGNMAAASGLGSIEAAQLAVDEFGGMLQQRPILVMNADYQNRSELAKHIGESWAGAQGMDVVVDVPSTTIAAELQNMFKAHNRLMLTSSASSTVMRHATCNDASISWQYDRDTLTHNLINALAGEGKKRWFLVNEADGYSQNLTQLARKQIYDSGGEVVGEAQLGNRMHGLKAIAAQAQQAKSTIIFLAFDRNDILHILKHWPQDANAPTAPLAFTDITLSDVHEFPKALPHFYTITTFYWNTDDASRAWAAQFAQHSRGAMPGTTHASVYSAVKHYLDAMKAGNDHSASGLIASMKQQALTDPLFNGSRIRNDGLVMHHALLLELKAPNEREKPWDYFRITHAIAPSDLILPEAVACERAGK